MKNELRISILSNDRDYSRSLYNKLKEEHQAEFQAFKNASEFLYELPNKPDIVLLDTSLEDMNPFQLMKAIKDFHSNINVVLLLNEELDSHTMKRYDHLSYSSIMKGDTELSSFTSIKEEILEDRIELQRKLASALKKRTEVLNNLRGTLDNQVKGKKASSLLSKLWESR